MNDYTEEQIRMWQNGTIMFIEALNKYTQERNRRDPEFNCEELDPEESCMGEDFFIDGDVITVRWEHIYSGGNYDVFSESFPLSHLWSIDWDQMEQEWTAERHKKQKDEAARKAAVAAKSAEQREQQERKELERLQQKYGATR